jgi:hypothetical protein
MVPIWLNIDLCAVYLRACTGLLAAIWGLNFLWFSDIAQFGTLIAIAFPILVYLPTHLLLKSLYVDEGL